MDLFVAKDGTLNCSVELENGAVLTMTLTDRGSDRIGVQEFVELRAEGVTVRMTNGADYVAEDRRRIIRCKKINKLQCYKTMYQHIGRSIIDGSAGDSLRSVSVSAGLTLALEGRLERLVSKTSQPRRSGSAEEIPGETVRRRARRPAAASSVVQAGPDLARGRRQPA
jgi:hypothetical protein